MWEGASHARPPGNITGSSNSKKPGRVCLCVIVCVCVCACVPPLGFRPCKGPESVPLLAPQCGALFPTASLSLSHYRFFVGREGRGPRDGCWALRNSYRLPSGWRRCGFRPMCAFSCYGFSEGARQSPFPGRWTWPPTEFGTDLVVKGVGEREREREREKTSAEDGIGSLPGIRISAKTFFSATIDGEEGGVGSVCSLFVHYTRTHSRPEPQLPEGSPSPEVTFRLQKSRRGGAKITLFSITYRFLGAGGGRLNGSGTRVTRPVASHGTRTGEVGMFCLMSIDEGQSPTESGLLA
ncbi:hypothetical protein LZ30DRAFT_207620 [Colletotrichum cereale]|nr:hypothetical protein LZ30DRAFT_207620 [Colletotrichum cereale]